MALVKRTSGSGSLKPIVGYARVKKMAVGDTIKGVLKGSLTTNTQFPKLNYLIELSEPFTFQTYKSESEPNVTINAKAGEVIALETFSELAKNLHIENDKGKYVIITYTGRAPKAKPGQQKAFLVDITVDEESGGNEEQSTGTQGAPASLPRQSSGFPFNKR